MNFKPAIVTLTAYLIPVLLLGQSESYTVNKARFSSETFDEFSPFYYRDGLVFCTNRMPGLSHYSDSQDVGLFNIYYIDTTGRRKNRRPELFSKDLTSRLNDGPATFNRAGDTVYYSRNLYIDGKLSDLSTSRNKLGIFYAVLKDEEWTAVRDFRFNNQWHNITTPSLSPCGKKLYFASDKPGGYGGYDLYYSEWENGYWGNPVNMGPVINTTGNEAYPFINESGELFFSSDGHPGLGGMDIFFSRFADTTWLEPVRLDPPVNSEHDDFGFITDPLMEEGYFSSNRDKSIDIYHFRTNFSQIFYEELQQENQYCFIFNDSGIIDVDTSYLQYQWTFGDGNSMTGTEVSHCYPGAGNYSVRLDIIEKGTGRLFFNKLEYDVDLLDFEQAYIDSPDVALSGDAVEFDGTKTFLPGYEILDYSWDFEHGNRASGKNVTHSFIEEGEYLVNLGLILRCRTSGDIFRTGASKKIIILNNRQEKELYLAERSSSEAYLPGIRQYENAGITIRHSAESKIQQNPVFSVEVISSKTRIDISNDIFRHIPDHYRIRERFNPKDSVYSYTVDQQMNIMTTYPAFTEMHRLGFRNTRVKLPLLHDPFERELYNLINTYGALADFYFDRYNKLTSNAYMMLDQIVRLMNNYPSLRLEIAVHTDNTESPEISTRLTQIRSQILVDFIINRGINENRLVATGFGQSRPVAPNTSEEEKLLNRRIEFIIH